MVKRNLRIPSGVWAWQGTALVVLVLALPTLVVLWLEPDARTFTAGATVVSLAAYPVMLVSAIMLYFAWRLTFEHGLAWLATVFTAAAIKGFSLAGLRAARGTELNEHATELLFVDLLFVATVVAMLLRWRREAPPADPVALGFGLGIMISALRAGLLEGGATAAAPAWALGIGLALLAVLYVGYAVGVTRLLTGPPWARTRVTAAVVLLGSNRVAFYGSTGDRVTGTLDLVTDGVAAALLCTAALGMLRLAIRDSASTVSQLHQRVEQVEARNRVDRERLHEINAAIAGIATASRLMHEEDEIPVERRVRLEHLVESEIARLEGMTGPRISEVREVSLDEALEPIVTGQRIQGRTIHWTPSGHTVVGRTEDVSEVVMTLLENAARHAPGSPVWIASRALDGAVEVTVSDVGPGIPADQSVRVFEWGRRGPGSRGQGIGLHVARRLVEELGGSLRLVPTNGCGATFALRLRLAGSAHGAATART